MREDLFKIQQEREREDLFKIQQLFRFSAVDDDGVGVHHVDEDEDAADEWWVFASWSRGEWCDWSAFGEGNAECEYLCWYGESCAA